MSFFLKTPDKTFSVIWYRDNKNNRVSTGIKIPTKYWDKNKHVVLRQHPKHKEINAKLSDFQPAVNKQKLLLPFFLEWATKGTATKTTPRREDAYSYRVIAGFARPDTTYEQVDYAFFNDFLLYLQRKGLAANSQGTHVRNLKAVMNEAYKRGWHNNLAFRNFKKPTEETDSIYLTEEELMRLRALQLSGYEDKVRDLFLIGCNTAMRFSDYSRITKAWFADGYIRFISTKTSIRQEIPLAAEVERIINKYGGHAPEVNQVVFNRLIKIICQKAEINAEIQTVKTIGREKKTKVYQKWELVSSHTARRTAASLLIKKGAPLAWVMNLTGHKTEAAFWRYVRLSKEDYAQLLRSYIK